MKVPSWVKRALRWALALAALAFVGSKLAANPEPLRQVLRIAPSALAALCALTILNQALMAVRLAVVMNHTVGVRLGFVAWFRLVSIGQMLNLAVPQLGNVYRAVALKRDFGFSYLSYATGLVTYVWLDMLMSFVTAIVAIVALEPTLALGGIPAVALLIAALLAFFLGPIVLAAMLERTKSRSGWVGRAQHRLATILSTANAAARSPGLMSRLLGLNVLVTIGQVASLWLGFRCVGESLSLSSLVVFQVFFKLSILIVVTPGNLGVTELVFSALAHGSARTVEQGVAVSLLLRAVGSAIVVLLGVLSGGAAVLFGGRRALLEQASRLSEDENARRAAP
jgi:uncharacterized membrane protein YbhN (UPF0104 family)